MSAQLEVREGGETQHREKAKMTVESFTVSCPRCDAQLAARNGSLMWTPEDLPKQLALWTCECGALVLITPRPKTARFA